MTRSVEIDLGPMPPHNLLVHVVGYVESGCRACDWLRAAGVISPGQTAENGERR